MPKHGDVPCRPQRRPTGLPSCALLSQRVNEVPRRWKPDHLLVRQVADVICWGRQAERGGVTPFSHLRMTTGGGHQLFGRFAGRVIVAIRLDLLVGRTGLSGV